jgi:hypothetical protein
MSYERRIAAARLSDSLLDQLLELERLREAVKKAEFFAKSRKAGRELRSDQKKEAAN